MIKSGFYCFPEMWNRMKGKQIQPKRARMTLPVTQHMTWSRHYAFTRIRDSSAREHAITGPPRLSISMGFSGSSHSLVCLICSCTRPLRQFTHAALNAIRLCYQKQTPEDQAEAVVAAAMGGKSQLEALISSLTICFPLWMSATVMWRSQQPSGPLWSSAGIHHIVFFLKAKSSSGWSSGRNQAIICGILITAPEITPLYH